MPASLISRLAILEIRRLDTANAIKFLKHVAANEGIICEPEALALIAGLAADSRAIYYSDLINCGRW